MSTHDQVMKAVAYRLGLGPDLHSPRVAWGRCVIESAELVDLHRGATDDPVCMVSVEGQNYPGRVHSAVVVCHGDEPADWQVIDVTARQFSADVAVPWTGTLIDWYDVVLDWLGDNVHVEVYAPDEHAPLGVAEWSCFTDSYDRDDIEPGRSVSYPWEVVAAC